MSSINKNRRAELQKILVILEQCSDRIEVVLDQESDSLDNIPENLQGSDRYSDMENAIDSLEDAVDKIEDAVERVKEVI